MRNFVKTVKKKLVNNGKLADRGSPAVPSAGGLRDDISAGNETTGWISPNYRISRAVQLVPDKILSNRCVGFFTNSPEVENYRLLRTQIQQRVRENGGNTLMVTSSVPNEGKTLTSINLAFTFAREFQQTVLLVDCDLRKQSIHEYLGYESRKGLIDYLRDNASVSELITWPGVEKLTIISGGRTTIGSSELLGSPRMKELVADMKTRYPDRFIIFDVPPILSAADALAFAPLVDYILMVVRSGFTPIQEISKSLRLMPQEKIIGLVLNRQKSTAEYYNSYYKKK